MAHSATGIYQIKNSTNGKVYIGQSVNILKRLAHHRGSLNLGTHPNYRLQNSWNKYGESSFEFIRLEECSRENLNQIEQRWIEETKSYDPKFGYNIIREVASGFMATDSWSNRMWIYKGSELRFVKVEDFGFGSYLGFIPGRPYSKDNSPHGFNWYHDGNEEWMLPPNDPRVSGLTKGKLHKNALGKVWVNNGSEEILSFPENVPEGFNKGRLRAQELAQRSSSRVWCNNGQEERQVTKEEFSSLVGFSRGRLLSMKGKTKGMIIFNNGLIELRFNPGEEIPNGFVQGRLIENIQALNKDRSSKKWFTDGERIIQLKEGTEPPEGFRPGRLRKS